MKVTSVHRPEHTALVGLLRELRLKTGLTQGVVAEKLGIAQTGISDVEIGVRGVDYLLVRDLCQIYGLSVADFDALLKKRLLNEKIEPALRIKRKDSKKRL
ncbi:helix-turn-helix domain-containing protein [Dyella humi]|uniref:Helix-turn-helix domain-containing protein n=1 Tax=Dyella humi TaxID=1770547 RepID=A0ABW8IJE4_9GAMM